MENCSLLPPVVIKGTATLILCWFTSSSALKRGGVASAYVQVRKMIIPLFRPSKHTVLIFTTTITVKLTSFLRNNSDLAYCSESRDMNLANVLLNRC